jgi:5'-nucleotidase
MRILITNDDGIRAEGLAALAEVASEFGEVKVAAPDHERSACGHAMTMHEPLRVKEVKWRFGKAYEVSGVPVDCVNVGLTIAWPDGCDLVLSGINHGANLGFDVTYSGTVGGAMEGAINGIPAIAVSMATLDYGDGLHLEAGVRWMRENWDWLVATAIPPGTFLNVNVPAVPFSEIRGSRIARMGRRVYRDRVEQRHDPAGRAYFWQGGVMVTDPPLPGTDVHAVGENFVSVTPLRLDWTDIATLEAMSLAGDCRAER